MTLKRIERKGWEWSSGAPSGRRVNKCDLELFKLNRGALIVVGERVDTDDAGVSVTNGFEWIAGRVLEEFDLLVNHCVFVEHWPPHGDHPESWDLVQLNFDPETGVCSKPRWTRIDRDVVVAFVRCLERKARAAERDPFNRG